MFSTTASGFLVRSFSRRVASSSSSSRSVAYSLLSRQQQQQAAFSTLRCPTGQSSFLSGTTRAPTAAAAPFHSTATVMMASTNVEDVIKNFSSPLVGTDVALAMQSLVDADCVCFDVDSTVINEEGIDVLADYLGKGEEVAALTRQAMEGGMKFQDALAARLSLLQPSEQSIQACLKAHPLQLTPGVEILMQELQKQNKDIFLVSGGFRIMIEPVAEMLNIPKENIVANHILFYDNGEYRDFDATEPTSRDMGKPKALEMIQASRGYKHMVMVGDGATDAQAKPPAKAFIGFGGVEVREKVKAVADWFVTDFADLTRVLQKMA